MTHHTAKKRFGQNFLTNDYVINEIIGIINPKPQEFIVEIGPGLAALTKPIMEHTNKLNVVELDRDIIKYLKTTFDDKLVIHEGDALKFDYTFNNEIIRVIGNLPYNISTPLLFHLAKYHNIKDMHFMLQKEVVERICAKPNNGDYGRLTVMLQYKFECFKMLDVSRECFDPAPKVESAIIRLIPRPLIQWQAVNEIKLNQVVTAAFNQRRKTIQNSLKNIISAETLHKLNIDLKKRAENITVSEYVELTSYIN
ncbi:MAG: 16S rRNA (adenine(1518)-N(6)/adenine(1519)-N(6))-dimethyltransferase RsmA [Proteobacteria bacterium]|jgi:16S rRNA (adenine1518-N6/adenine1519-N6)-dimethyltransferase|nr:16S rRNA (adenine(1518)-N(6)/adenine(1519)-N(6))-dimethyltransferase RsmA [Pseudomonadota bacterium]